MTQEIMDIPPLHRVTLDGDGRIHEVMRRLNRAANAAVEGLRREGIL